MHFCMMKHGLKTFKETKFDKAGPSWGFIMCFIDIKGFIGVKFIYAVFDIWESELRNKTPLKLT